MRGGDYDGIDVIAQKERFDVRLSIDAVLGRQLWCAGAASDGDELEVVAEDFGSFFLSAIENEFGPS